MRKQRKGLGGVIFGNAVTAQVGHMPIKYIQWITSAENSKFGHFLVQFTDGAEFYFGPVRTEDASVAQKILFPSKGSGPNTGEGIGLIGAASTRILSVKREGVTTTGWQSVITMHPALQSTDLGWAGLIADTQPKLMAKLTALIGADNVRILRQTGWNPVHDARKITDVPLVVRSDGNRLFVMRKVSTSEHLEADLIRSAFITMEVIPAQGHSVDPAFPELFYRVVPTLIQQSCNYDRLNTFAAVLAFVRWSRAHGATFKGRPTTPDLPPTPPAVFHNSSGYKSIALFDGSEIRQGQCDQMARLYRAARSPVNLQTTKSADYWLAWIKDECGADYAASAEGSSGGIFR
jgi:hypothetical protein